jgi:Tfp pilus assembly protein PilE
MALLKKLKGASLVETLTASVIIVVVFMIASFSFNNVFLNSVRSDNNLLQNRLQELKYLAEYGRLPLPFFEDGAYWTISAEEVAGTVEFHISNLSNGKEYEIQLLE